MGHNRRRGRNQGKELSVSTTTAPALVTAASSSAATAANAATTTTTAAAAAAEPLSGAEYPGTDEVMDPAMTAALAQSRALQEEADAGDPNLQKALAAASLASEQQDQARRQALNQADDAALQRGVAESNATAAAAAFAAPPLTPACSSSVEQRDLEAAKRLSKAAAIDYMAKRKAMIRLTNKEVLPRVLEWRAEEGQGASAMQKARNTMASSFREQFPLCTEDELNTAQDFACVAVYAQTFARAGQFVTVKLALANGDCALWSVLLATMGFVEDGLPLFFARQCCVDLLERCYKAGQPIGFAEGVEVKAKPDDPNVKAAAFFEKQRQMGTYASDEMLCALSELCGKAIAVFTQQMEEHVTQFYRGVSVPLDAPYIALGLSHEHYVPVANVDEEVLRAQEDSRWQLMGAQWPASIPSSTAIIDGTCRRYALFIANVLKKRMDTLDAYCRGVAGALKERMDVIALGRAISMSLGLPVADEAAAAQATAVLEAPATSPTTAISFDVGAIDLSAPPTPAAEHVAEPASVSADAATASVLAESTAAATTTPAPLQEEHAAEAPLVDATSTPELQAPAVAAAATATSPTPEQDAAAADEASMLILTLEEGDENKPAAATPPMLGTPAAPEKEEAGAASTLLMLEEGGFDLNGTATQSLLRSGMRPSDASGCTSCPASSPTSSGGSMGTSPSTLSLEAADSGEFEGEKEEGEREEGETGEGGKEEGKKEGGKKKRRKGKNNPARVRQKAARKEKKETGAGDGGAGGGGGGERG